MSCCRKHVISELSDKIVFFPKKLPRKLINLKANLRKTNPERFESFTRIVETHIVSGGLEEDLDSLKRT